MGSFFSWLIYGSISSQIKQLDVETSKEFRSLVETIEKAKKESRKDIEHNATLITEAEVCKAGIKANYLIAKRRGDKLAMDVIYSEYVRADQELTNALNQEAALSKALAKYTAWEADVFKSRQQAKTLQTEVAISEKLRKVNLVGTNPRLIKLYGKLQEQIYINKGLTESAADEMEEARRAAEEGAASSKNDFVSEKERELRLREELDGPMQSQSRRSAISDSHACEEDAIELPSSTLMMQERSGIDFVSVPIPTEFV